jgi:glycopeptide antibiotics resistance protein
MIYFSEKLVSENVTEFVAEKKSYNNFLVLLPFVVFVTIAFITISVYRKSYVFLAALCFILLISISLYFNSIQEESILVIQDFGIQLRRKYQSGREETKVNLSKI